MSQPTALVTGGAGFIGSHLCGLLLEKGWKVEALDNFSTGSPENVAHLKDNPDFNLTEGCASDYELVEKLSDGAKTIFHLAAVVGVKKVVDDPVNTIEINHESTKTVLHAALRHNIRVVVTSSSEVYGANPHPRFFEEDICMIGPTSHRRWCYSASKLLDEFHAFAYFYKYNLPVTIVRLFNTIGERQVGSYGMVVPTFIRQALAGENLTVFGSGEQKRCFTYVGDVVKSLFLLAENEKSAGQVFNIGSTNEISVNELANKVKELTGSKSEIIYKSYKEAYGENFEDVERRYPDTTRLNDTIGYHPETPLEEVLNRIITDIK